MRALEELDQKGRVWGSPATTARATLCFCPTRPPPPYNNRRCPGMGLSPPCATPVRTNACRPNILKVGRLFSLCYFLIFFLLFFLSSRPSPENTDRPPSPRFGTCPAVPRKFCDPHCGRPCTPRGSSPVKRCFDKPYHLQPEAADSTLPPVPPNLYQRGTLGGRLGSPLFQWIRSAGPTPLFHFPAPRKPPAPKLKHRPPAPWECRAPTRSGPPNEGGKTGHPRREKKRAARRGPPAFGARDQDQARMPLGRGPVELRPTASTKCFGRQAKRFPPGPPLPRPWSSPLPGSESRLVAENPSFSRSCRGAFLPRGLPENWVSREKPTSENPVFDGDVRRPCIMDAPARPARVKRGNWTCHSAFT